jgi:pimeloyl-ACP methyl ester carboxylesterase
VSEIVERAAQVAGRRTHWRESPGEGRPPILYVHGVPTASWDWNQHLERIGGIAPDLPGFGESAKPADFDHSNSGYADWLEAFTEAVGLERFSLVLHDFGGPIGLTFAQRVPERVERIVLHTGHPLLPGYRWHWIAQIWRRRGLGELFMAASTRWGFKQLSRQSNAKPGPLPDDFLDRFWKGFDRGTRHTILRLYRASPPERNARDGERLGHLRCPALILWATKDPYVGSEWGQRYADALGGDARLEMIENAGHWMWLDRPDVIDKAAEFLEPAASTGQTRR